MSKRSIYLTSSPAHILASPPTVAARASLAGARGLLGVLLSRCRTAIARRRLLSPPRSCTCASGREDKRDAYNRARDGYVLECIVGPFGCRYQPP